MTRQDKEQQVQKNESTISFYGKTNLKILIGHALMFKCTFIGTFIRVFFFFKRF